MSQIKRTATVVGRGIVIQLPQEVGGEKALVAQIDITCPDCGKLEYRIAGHHLKSIRDLLIGWIDQFPELCGGEHKEVERSQFSGTGPSDPSVN